MANIDILRTELTDDPLPRGYLGMSDSEAVVSLNTVDRELNKTSMTGSEIAQAIVKAAFVLLSAEDQQQVWDILHLGNINPFGIEADLFIDIFGASSDTITALAALRKDDVSRGTEIGYGPVHLGDVIHVRNLP